MTAPSSCANKFSYVTTVQVIVPTEVTNQITPASATSWFTTETFIAEGPSTFTEVNIFLEPGVATDQITTPAGDAVLANMCIDPRIGDGVPGGTAATTTNGRFWHKDGGCEPGY